MMIDSESMVSISEANQNFSKVARMVDEHGSAVILKNNAPKYVLLDYAQFMRLETTHSEQIDSIARRILDENLDAFRELAK